MKIKVNELPSSEDILNDFATEPITTPNDIKPSDVLSKVAELNSTNVFKELTKLHSNRSFNFYRTGMQMVNDFTKLKNLSTLTTLAESELKQFEAGLVSIHNQLKDQTKYSTWLADVIALYSGKLSPSKNPFKYLFYHPGERVLYVQSKSSCAKSDYTILVNVEGITFTELQSTADSDMALEDLNLEIGIAKLVESVYMRISPHTSV